MPSYRLALPRAEIEGEISRLIDALRSICGRLAGESAPTKSPERTRLADLILPTSDDARLPTPEVVFTCLLEFAPWREYVIAYLRRAFADDSQALADQFKSMTTVRMGGSRGAWEALGGAMTNALVQLTSISKILPLADDARAASSARATACEPLADHVFVVHGRETPLRVAVENLLRKVGLEPVVLADQPNEGIPALIEKLEANSNVAHAVVIYTPDDEGALRGDKPAPRARENVVLELGYFIGKLGRKKVTLLLDPSAWHMSDLKGCAHVEVRSADWERLLIKELRAAGLPGNWQKFL